MGDSNLDRFNTTFKEFLRELKAAQVGGGDAEFNMINMATSAVIMASPKLLHEGFKERVAVPFGDRIVAKDEAFFLEANYADVAGDMQDAERVINKVKGIYRCLSEDDRAVVWKYMRVLVLLSRKMG
jgi:hypothetical protein